VAFQIILTEVAKKQLDALAARDQAIIEAEIQSKLEHEPSKPTRAIKKLRPNPLAAFELRVGDFRVLYNVDADRLEVVLAIIGQKEGNKLIVEGKEFHGHEGDPAP